MDLGGGGGGEGGGLVFPARTKKDINEGHGPEKKENSIINKGHGPEKESKSIILSVAISSCPPISSCP